MKNKHKIVHLTVIRFLATTLPKYNQAIKWRVFNLKKDLKLQFYIATGKHS